MYFLNADSWHLVTHRLCLFLYIGFDFCHFFGFAKQFHCIGRVWAKERRKSCGFAPVYSSSMVSDWLSGIYFKLMTILYFNNFCCLWAQSQHNVDLRIMQVCIIIIIIFTTERTKNNNSSTYVVQNYSISNEVYSAIDRHRRHVINLISHESFSCSRCWDDLLQCKHDIIIMYYWCE